MKKYVKWVLFVLILSGWVAFGILYAVAARERAGADVKISELKSELDSYQFLVKDVETSSEKIDSIIGTLEHLKENLEKLKNKMEKKQGEEPLQDKQNL